MEGSRDSAAGRHPAPSISGDCETGGSAVGTLANMAERGLIYGRASRDPRHSGTSVDDQIRECAAWADANGSTDWHGTPGQRSRNVLVDV